MCVCFHGYALVVQCRYPEVSVNDVFLFCEEVMVRCAPFLARALCMLWAWFARTGAVPVAPYVVARCLIHVGFPLLSGPSPLAGMCVFCISFPLSVCLLELSGRRALPWDSSALCVSSSGCVIRCLCVVWLCGGSACLHVFCIPRIAHLAYRFLRWSVGRRCWCVAVQRVVKSLSFPYRYGPRV